MKLLALTLAGVAAVTLTVACAPPQQVDAPWLSTATGDLCARDHATQTIYLDLAAIATAEVLHPGTRKWCVAHEEAHLRLDGSGISFGPGMVGLERLAQCGAEDKLGHGPPYTDNVNGYWDCPDADLARLRLEQSRG